MTSQLLQREYRNKSLWNSIASIKSLLSSSTRSIQFIQQDNDSHSHEGYNDYSYYDQNASIQRLIHSVTKYAMRCDAMIAKRNDEIAMNENANKDGHNGITT